MLIYELLHRVDEVREIIDISAEPVELSRHLKIPDDVRYERYEPAKAENLDIGADGLLVCLVGDAPKHTDTDALAPVLGALQPGARAILLLAWPIDELPYHRLLGPLVDNRCQVVETVPLDRVRNHGAHCALVVQRVTRLAEPRPYLTDAPAATAAEAAPPTAGAATDAQAVDELRSALRIANEYMLADLVARPMRRRLREQDQRIAELNRELAVQTARLARLESSASYQIGRAMISGARNPGRGLVTVPRDLARIWRRKSQKAQKTTAGPSKDG